MADEVRAGLQLRAEAGDQVRDLRLGLCVVKVEPSGLPGQVRNHLGFSRGR